MELVEKIKAEIINESDKYKQNAADHYDFWSEHIKYVYEESILLAEKFDADAEIVALGSLLHDIALIRKAGDKKDHHINGAVIAESILRKHTCDDTLIQKVTNCVLHHRSSKVALNAEELCVADADILAHFDNIPMLFHLAFTRHNVELSQVRSWMKAVFEDDFADLSDKTKEEFRLKYELICKIVLGE